MKSSELNLYLLLISWLLTENFMPKNTFSEMMLYKTSLQEILVGVKKVSGNEFLFFILSVREGRRAKPTVFRLLKIAKM